MISLGYNLIPPHFLPKCQNGESTASLPLECWLFLRVSTFQSYMIASQLLFCQLKAEQHFSYINVMVHCDIITQSLCDCLTSVSAFILENSASNCSFLPLACIVYQGIYMFMYLKK